MTLTQGLDEAQVYILRRSSHQEGEAQGAVCSPLLARGRAGIWMKLGRKGVIDLSPASAVLGRISPTEQRMT